MAKTMFEPTGACGCNAADNISSSTNKILYYNLLTSGKFHSHLADVEDGAQFFYLRLVKKYAERKGMSEQLKAEIPTEWVRKMNNIRSQVIEYTGKELIYI